MGCGLFHWGLFFRSEQTYVSTTVIVIGLIGLIVLTMMQEFHIPSWLLAMIVYASSRAGDDRDLAWTEAQYAVKRASWDPSIQQQMATVALQLGHLPEAYHWSQKVTQDGPLT